MYPHMLQTMPTGEVHSLIYIARYYIGSMSSEKTIAMTRVYVVIAKPGVNPF